MMEIEKFYESLLAASTHWRPRESSLDESSASSEEQVRVEREVRSRYRYAAACHRLTEGDLESNSQMKLHSVKHTSYLAAGLFLSPLSSYYTCLDASRTWLVYWTVHSLRLLGKRSIINETTTGAIDFIGRCKDLTHGGYCGSPGQHPHLATSYSAVNALVSLCSKEALDSIDRPALVKFLNAMRQADGSFTMHRDGEIDVRGAYCALSVAVLSGIYSDELFSGTAEWIISCQTYEGGFSGFPGCEAHGGYSFCAIAALCLLNRADDCDLDALLRWTVNRQMQYEGGFSGRTNKLVDGCYSFWQAAVVRMIEIHGQNKNRKEFLNPKNLLFNECALQMYLLLACQFPDGGMIDKPGKSPDYYHTCYDLSGLSLSQSGPTEQPLLGGEAVAAAAAAATRPLEWVSPYFNVSADAYQFAERYNEEHSNPMRSTKDQR